jgi:hypothetical protein
MGEIPEKDALEKRKRKKYMPPELVVYGSLVEITRTLNVGNFDGISGSREKV